MDGQCDFTLSDHNPLEMALALRARGTHELVRVALQERRCALALQNVVNAQNPEGTPAFKEGLIRIFKPDGSLIPAAHFMSDVEATPLGREIDCEALRMGFDALRAQLDLRLSINMSARSIGYPKWRALLKRVCETEPEVAERLILEITESSAMQVPELVVHFMSEFQRCGVTFALDDFGAGQTALRYFKDFLFDIMKIDRMFVHDIDRDPNSQCLVKALVMIAQQFDMFVVAEGVERPEEADFLKQAGVDCLQGYLFDLPTVPEAAKEQFFAVT